LGDADALPRRVDGAPALRWNFGLEMS